MQRFGINDLELVAQILSQMEPVADWLRETERYLAAAKGAKHQDLGRRSSLILNRLHEGSEGSPARCRAGALRLMPLQPS